MRSPIRMLGWVGWSTLVPRPVNTCVCACEERIGVHCGCLWRRRLLARQSRELKRAARGQRAIGQTNPCRDHTVGVRGREVDAAGDGEGKAGEAACEYKPEPHQQGPVGASYPVPQCAQARERQPRRTNSGTPKKAASVDGGVHRPNHQRTPAPRKWRGPKRRLSRRRNHHATPVSRRPTHRMETRERTVSNVRPGVGSTLRASASCVGVGEIGVASSMRAPFSSSGSTCTFGRCGFSFAMDELGRTRVVTRACALRAAFESATVAASHRPSGSMLLDAEPPDDAAAAVAVPASLPLRLLPPYPCTYPCTHQHPVRACKCMVCTVASDGGRDSAAAV